MRISTLEGDKGFSPTAHLAIVTLDGSKVEKCVIADDYLKAVMLEDGTVLRGKVVITETAPSKGKKHHG